MRDLFNDREATLICDLPFSKRIQQDRWYWALDEKGSYSVKSAYKKLHKPVDISNSELWKLVWALQIPPKIKNFL